MRRIYTDDTVLSWLERRRAGQTCLAIARTDGADKRVVLTTTNRVRAADLAESGEGPVRVLEGYW
ncbi:hypothetical protein [Limimaricola cinnabarinus]|uniref:Uncharacterized protein n=1 Tax=Limimaricola cinnabarinus TaxID=1125964 RepID=A0A2G1MH53_9RHOB|nr:hypothetical protein [Limimaricola cinnabarinus]PHP28017.1 hypothetical protein CJ301_08515 [Limimaricola cinnabarinus]